MTNRRLINRLKEIRSAKGLTQAELAEQVGVSRKTINTVENGVFIPSAQLAFVIAEVLGLPVDEIFSLE